MLRYDVGRCSTMVCFGVGSSVSCVTGQGRSNVGGEGGGGQCVFHTAIKYFGAAFRPVGKLPDNRSPVADVSLGGLACGFVFVDLAHTVKHALGKAACKLRHRGSAAWTGPPFSPADSYCIEKRLKVGAWYF